MNARTLPADLVQELLASAAQNAWGVVEVLRKSGVGIELASTPASASD